MPWSDGLLLPASDLQDHIEKAIITIPNNKAAGPYLVTAEAMKTALKHPAEFLANLWRAVGRTVLSEQSFHCTRKEMQSPPNCSTLTLQESH